MVLCIILIKILLIIFRSDAYKMKNLFQAFKFV